MALTIVSTHFFEIGNVPEAIEPTLECDNKVVRPGRFVGMFIGRQSDRSSLGIDSSFEVGKVAKALESHVEGTTKII